MVLPVNQVFPIKSNMKSFKSQSFMLSYVFIYFVKNYII